jgi:hypothetical protein
MSGGRASRQKGNRIERAIVHALRAAVAEGRKNTP